MRSKGNAKSQNVKGLLGTSPLPTLSRLASLLHSQYRLFGLAQKYCLWRKNGKYV